MSQIGLKPLLVKVAKGGLSVLARAEEATLQERSSRCRTVPATRDIRRIIIWSMDRIGDVVRATPAIRAISERYPHAHISAVIAGRSASVLANSPRLHELTVIDSPYDLRQHVGAARKLGRHPRDLGILLECDPYWVHLGRWFFRAVGVERWTAFDFGDGAPGAATKVSIARNKSWIGQFNALSAAADAPTRDERTELFLSQQEVNAARNFLFDHGIDPFGESILLHPGGNFLKVSRQWPASAYAQLVTSIRRHCDTPILVSGLPQELPLFEQIRRQTRVPLTNLVGRLSLRQLMAVISQMTLCIMNDTGPLHIANALGVKAVAILGPTGPEVVGIPPTCRTVRLDLACSPCAFHQGWQACRNPVQWQCLRDLPPAQVLNVVLDQLRAAGLNLRPTGLTCLSSASSSLPCARSTARESGELWGH